MIGDEPRARRDLDEAMRIARRCEIRLFECDAELEFARLELALADRAQAGNEPEKVRERLARAREHATAAKHLITDTGYHRRDRELADLEARLGPLE